MKSKFTKVSVMLGIVFACMLSMFAVQASAATGYIDKAETGAVYLWNSSTSSSAKTTMGNGTYISYVGSTQNGRAYVNCYAGSGWVTNKYLFRQASISGAETGRVYRWSDSWSQSYKNTISNGTTVYVSTSRYSNGRIYGFYISGGVKHYGWFTSRYVWIR